MAKYKVGDYVRVMANVSDSDVCLTTESCEWSDDKYEFVTQILHIDDDAHNKFFLVRGTNSTGWPLSRKYSVSDFSDDLKMSADDLCWWIEDKAILGPAYIHSVKTNTIPETCILCHVSNEYAVKNLNHSESGKAFACYSCRHDYAWRLNNMGYVLM